MNKYWSNIKTLIVLLLCVLFLSNSGNCDTKDEKRVLNLTQFVKEMMDAEGTYYLADAIVRFDMKTDALFEEDEGYTTQKKHIKAKIRLRAVEFQRGINVHFSNFVFEEILIMYDCIGIEPYYLFFSFCTFKNGLDFRRNSMNTLGLLNCQVYNSVKLIQQRVGQFYLESTRFAVNVPKLDQMENGKLIPPFFYTYNLDESTYFMEISDCEFLYKLPMGNSGNVILSTCYFSNLSILNSYFDIPVDFTDATIANKFEVMGNTFMEGIFTGDVQTPEFNTRITWDQISGNNIKIVYDFLDDGSGVFTYTIYDPFTPEGISDKNNYNRLVHSYAKLYRFYKDQGDVISARACLVEWKDLETLYFGHLYEKEMGVFNYFKWKMNVFLDVFCDYGTNPIKSLLWSFYVILGFAAVYFILPYDLNSEKQNPIMKLIKGLVLISVGEQFDSKSKLGKIVKPLSFIFNILGFIVYGLFIIVQRMLNAVILSLNLFTSLGFGTIQVKGVLMYLAVIEGFTGWFLLSIFSVSLISQVLQ